MKKILTAFLVLILTFLETSAYANGEMSTTHNHCICGVSDCAENHGETVNWQAWNGDVSVGTVDDTSKTAIYLYLEENVTITSTLNITNVTIYLCLNGKTLTINNAGKPAVCVGANQKFVLCDCKDTGKITGAKGSAESNTAQFGAINCQSGSNFVMYGGSISNNTVEKANGGGIFVNGGTFTMYGGSVNNNKAPNGSGGAISVENGNIYTYGGEMNDNSAINGGAIHLNGNTKGEIRNIKADNNAATGSKNGMGGAIYTETGGLIQIHNVELSNNKAVSGGGIYLNSTANNIYTNIYNANIHDNSATGNGGGVFLDGNGKSNPSTSIYDSKICGNVSGNNGGGIFATSDAMLNLYGGTISDNTCTGSGGGIRVASSTYFAVTNYKNPVYINGNKASDGGGISTAANALNLIGKCEIEDNTATDRGGGVYVNRSSMFLLFNQTTITKNTAPQGGGIYLNKDDTGRELEILGGTTIIGNTSSENGLPSNLYLNNGRMFQFRKGLTGSEKVGVSVSETPTFSEPVDIEYVFDEEWHDTGGDRSNLIIPDNADYKVIYKNNKHWLIPKTSLTLIAGKITVLNLDKPAVLFVASYDRDRLLDTKTMPLDSIEKTSVDISEIDLNTTGATKIVAFLWDSNIRPLCATSSQLK